MKSAFLETVADFPYTASGTAASGLSISGFLAAPSPKETPQEALLLLLNSVHSDVLPVWNLIPLRGVRISTLPSFLIDPARFYWESVALKITTASCDTVALTY